MRLEMCLVYCVSRVPAPVLMSKFSDTTKALMDVMSKQATSDTASALRWVRKFSLSLFVSLFAKQQQRLILTFFAPIDPVVLGYFVEEAGCICLDLPIDSSGLPRPPQLHSAQQA